MYDSIGYKPGDGRHEKRWQKKEMIHNREKVIVSLNRLIEWSLYILIKRIQNI